jgi:hypothetical protein
MAACFAAMQLQSHQLRLDSPQSFLKETDLELITRNQVEGTA